ncbi:molybdopterin-dependent oxidoreductase [Caldinitratiruptor microaerophilus]|uniref:Molybdopterin oxidoreductase n=1 Tax=Caldinitratiruptor microaerophilus TaxID=671077 RepID=A0AA35G7M3_9FIRM|nr:molybdopterin-dependent oxidoreductase [Caldinitratiruptor microaerophilus]BDG60050.1 molybdopterin oxidoreductase [Caldinitratiruptor microaerophilus]
MSGTREKEITRRDFLKAGLLVGGGVFLGSQLGRITELLQKAEAGTLSPAEAYELAQIENQLFTVCLQCNTGCPIKVKILDGVAVKIDGNPLSPWTMHPHLPMKTKMTELATVEGAICPKGQAGIQTVYDPYRIRKVLKRAGRRGENKWMTIDFDQAIREIAEGGYLFKHVPGEENRYVPGLKDVMLPKGVKIPKEMAADAARVGEHKLSLEEFKAKYKDYLQYLIDPDHPDLGLKANQFVFNWGRAKSGRDTLIRRFTAAVGSVNAHGHTTVCQGSLYFTGKAMSEQYAFDPKKGEYSWGGGEKFYWQADIENSEFVLFVGANLFEGNYGPPLRAPGITNGIAEGRLKIAVADPRFSKVAAKAWKWLPIKPGYEAALGLALARWIIENRRFDERFLANANRAAADADGEPSFSNGAWLVKIVDGKPTTFVRASELGLPTQERKAKVGDREVTYTFDPLVVLKDGQPVPFDPTDKENPVEGDVLVSATINGVQVKSAVQVLYDEAASRSIKEWADLCGLREQDIVEVARELTSHGKKAAIDIHRGVSQHTNGFYNVGVFYCVNLLLGNFDWKGGMVKASTYDNVGTKKGKPFNQDAFPGKPTTFGLSIIRHDAKYDKTTLFQGYPAKRPFFPLSSDVYQEVFASIGDGYPYPVKILFQYMGSPVYSLPAGHKVAEILRDVEKLPLFVSSDIVIGETSMFADYIFPDLSYLERWEFQGSHPSNTVKSQPIRQPVIAPLTETVTVYGQDQPISFETMLLALAEKLGLPGFGKDAFGPGRHFTNMDEYYLPMAANVAFGDKEDGSDAVPEASPEEIELFIKARRHLPRTVFDPDRWKAIVGEEHWARTVYVLNRGGRWQDPGKQYDGEKVKNVYGKQINLYQEKTYLVKDSMTGKHLSGIPTFFPPYQDALGNSLLGEENEYPLNLITFRYIQHTKSRTSGNYWVLPLDPEGGLLVSAADAAKLGLRTGDQVKIVSASNPDGVWDFGPGGRKEMIATVKVVQGMRPGVVGFPLGYGHWAYGAWDVIIDGQVVKGDGRRGRGVHGNAAMRVDPHLKNVSLQDLAGGSVVFYDTRVKLVKV